MGLWSTQGYEIPCALRLLRTGEAVYKPANTTEWHTVSLGAPQGNLVGEVRCYHL